MQRKTHMAIDGVRTVAEKDHVIDAIALPRVFGFSLN
jgi:hypothetical protein